MKKFLGSNAGKDRLIRTIIQGVIGCIIANLDLLIGLTPFPTEIKPFIVAVVMAVLSPVMAYFGEDDEDLEV